MKHEAFLVMVNRTDEAMPGLEKADPKIYFDRAEAEARRNFVNEIIGPHYGVYRVEVEIKERLL